MNDRARSVFRQAALAGTRQAFNVAIKVDEQGQAFCAGQLLVDAVQKEEWWVPFDLGRKVSGCPLCGVTKYTNGSFSGCDLRHETDLLVHYNNDHQLDWLGIAEKMPVSEELEVAP